MNLSSALIERSWLAGVYHLRATPPVVIPSFSEAEHQRSTLTVND